MASKIDPGRLSEATCVKRGSKDDFWLHFGLVLIHVGNFLDNFLAVVISFPRCVFGMFRYKTLNTSCARKCMKCRLTGHTACASGTSTQGCGRGRA